MPASERGWRPVSRQAHLRLALLGVLLMGAPPAAAQDWLVFQGVADGEFWASDSGSRLLTRNDGHPGLLGRLYLWTGVAPAARLQLVALTEMAAGSALNEDAEVSLEGLTLRYTPFRALVIEGGKLVSPVGAFGPRRFSPTNPLIGQPDAYSTAYPWAGQLSGSVSHLDYRVAVVSLPAVHEDYVPEPQAIPRLVVGGGVTPVVGVRVGASFTRGPYLSDELSPLIPAGNGWKDFKQEVLAFDGRVSRGYLEFHGELDYSWYDVPTISGRVSGVAYYAEVKYTWSPRFFSAARFQRNDYPFVLPLSRAQWIGKAVNFYAGEAGIGIRLDQHTLAKISYQQDNWTASPNGRAVAVQLSYQFDVREWLARRQ